MSKTVRRLGRGLDALVSDMRMETPPPTPVVPAGPPGKAQTSPKPTSAGFTLPIDSLEPNPFQPRSAITSEQVQSLVRSVQRNGILQPLAVRRIGERFQIIAGERRWTAAKLAGLFEVPVIIREASDEQMLELALIENLHREQLHAIDRAKAYRNFCGRFDLKPEELAERLGEDRTTVTNYLRLLDLPASVHELLIAGKLSMGHARCLLSEPDVSRRIKLAEAIVQHDLSVRATEEVMREGKAHLATKGRDARPSVETAVQRVAAPHLADMCRRFEEVLKTKVRILEGKRKGAGKLMIEFYSVADFDRIAERLGVEVELER